MSTTGSNKESAPLSSALCLTKMPSELGADDRQVTKVNVRAQHPQPCCASLCHCPWQAANTRREAWATALVGMAEKLLLKILDFLGRQGLHLGSFQIITAAFEGSSGFRGHQIQQKSDCAHPLVPVWPGKGQLQEGQQSLEITPWPEGANEVTGSKQLLPKASAGVLSQL